MANVWDNLSRAVSHALRHEPWIYELELDEGGWADVGALLTALREESSAWSNLAETDLAEMIQKSSKQRHEMINGRIRALYGHSLPGRLSKVPLCRRLSCSMERRRRFGRRFKRKGFCR